jgi:hypothetical protein
MASWYSVRCIFFWRQHAGRPYEERITLWLADSHEQAIELAEQDAREYARTCGFDYLELAQSYKTDIEEGIENGTEVFSLLRDSELEPDDYLDRYFDSGAEHTGHSGYS